MTLTFRVPVCYDTEKDGKDVSGMSKTDGNIRFRTRSGQTVCDELHTEDWNGAASFKMIRAGTLGLYYKQMFRRYFIPYSEICRIYKQVQIIPVDDSPPYEHYRIIMEGSEGRIAEIMFGEGFMDRTEDNDTADHLLETLRHIESAQHIHIGYDEDSAPPSRKSIWRRT